MYTPGATPMLPMVQAWVTSFYDIPGASGAWEAANRAVYFPLIVPAPCVIRRLWWVNGASVSASYTIDCGLYADAGYKPGARIVSTGDTAQGTATNVQFVDVADTAIAPGRYWLALACSATGATFFRGAATGLAPLGADAAMRMNQSTARPLPATATPAESAERYSYMFGFSTTASP